MTSETNSKALTKFGLSPSQARVYLTIAQLGLVQVGVIAKVSGTSREDVYRILPKLEKVGLIERTLDRPVKIRVAPMEKALHNLVRLEQKKSDSKMAELSASTDEFLKHFAKLPSEEEKGEEIQFLLIKDRDIILNKGMDLFSSAESEVDIVLSRKKLFTAMFRYADVLKRAIRNGVRFRVMTEAGEADDSLPRVIEEQIVPVRSLELNYAAKLPSHFLIIDNREALINTSMEADLGDTPSLWTNNSSVVSLARQNFEDLWQRSKSWMTQTEIHKQS